MKPGQIEFQSNRSSRSQARPWKKIVSAKTRKTAAAPAMAAPFPRLETFSVTSAFASSISS